MKIFTPKYNCNCCKKKIKKQIFSIKNVPIKTANNSLIKIKSKKKTLPLTLNYCSYCTNIQIKEIVDPKILYDNFSYKTSSSIGLSKHFENLAKFVFKKFKLKNTDQVIDIGSNDGVFLKYFKKNKVKVLGIEPSKKISNLANKNKINTINSFFNQKLAKRIYKIFKPARIVSCFNTLANINNLNNFLSGMKILMNENSIGIIETQYGLDVIKKNLIDTIYHEHINYFTKNSLNKLFVQKGLIITKFQKINNKGGSLRIFFKLKQKTEKIKNKIKIDLASEKKRINLNKINNFKNKIFKVQNEISNFLKKNEINSINGFGASVGTSTLVCFFNLQNKLKIIFDDNPQVKKLEFNDYNIKVENSKFILKKNKNKILVIFAYRYLDIIKIKHDKFLKKGGILLCPLPKFRQIKR